jgi:signal transduction histidine kinase
MIVKDNGQGFDLSDLEKAPPGYHGLNIIKERVEGLGGSLSISTASGEGTELMVSLPLEKVRL